MNKDEALRLAEEALKHGIAKMNYANVTPISEACMPLHEALAAIRVALGDPVDTSEECVEETVECGHEPVGWIHPQDLEILMKLKENYQSDTICGYQMNKNADDPKDRGVPLYAAPVEPVKQEPVAWRTFEGECGCYAYRGYEDNEDYRDVFIKRNGQKYASWVEPLYTTQQPRQDVDLTDAITLLEEGLEGISSSWNKRARAVLAKYKEKNK